MLANLPLLPGMRRMYVQSLQYGTWFDGVNDYVLRTVANFRSADASGRITARFQTSASVTGCIFGSADASASNSLLQVGILSTGALWIQTRAPGVIRSVRTVATFNDGLSHLVEFASNGSAWSITVDGDVESIVVNETANTGTWFSLTPTTRDNITVGVLKNITPINYFVGTIYEVNVYDGSSNLVLEWIGDGNANANWVDSVSANNGLLQGSPAQAISLDGGITWAAA